MTSRWYTIQILPNLQKSAEFNLERQNYEFFFPEVIVKKSRLIGTITEPLFKGYGFVRFDIEINQWRSINGTRGVVGLLPKWGRFPEPMEVGFVEYFIESGPIQTEEFEEVLTEFYPGLVVEMNEGLMKGRRGVVISVRTRLLELCFEPRARNLLVNKTDVSVV